MLAALIRRTLGPMFGPIVPGVMLTLWSSGRVLGLKIGLHGDRVATLRGSGQLPV